MALFAVYAASKNKFWEMNDLLYSLAGQKTRINIKELVEEVGLDINEFAPSINARTTRYRLHNDIRTGNKLGISGTPAYLINGELYLGKIPPDVINSVMR